MFVFVPETEGVALNGTCTDNSNCTDNVHNSVCEADTCKCETGYQENSGNCESKCGLINSWQFVIIIYCLLIFFFKRFSKKSFRTEHHQIVKQYESRSGPITSLELIVGF